MKKLLSVLLWVLLALLALYPSAVALCSAFGYVFQLASDTAYGLVILCAALLIAGLTALPKGAACADVGGLRFCLLAPLALLCAGFHLYYTEGDWDFIVVLLYLGSCAYLSIRYGRPRAPGIIVGALCLLLMSPPALFVFLMGSVRTETVVRTELSPAGTYRAELIDDDQGALGGGTRVTVRENKGFDAGVFKVFPKPRELYYGPWGEFDRIEVRWEDEHRLSVKGRVYEIP